MGLQCRQTAAIWNCLADRAAGSKQHVVYSSACPLGSCSPVPGTCFLMLGLSRRLQAKACHCTVCSGCGAEPAEGSNAGVGCCATPDRGAQGRGEEEVKCGEGPSSLFFCDFYITFSGFFVLCGGADTPWRSIAVRMMLPVGHCRLSGSGRALGRGGCGDVEALWGVDGVGGQAR